MPLENRIEELTKAIQTLTTQLQTAAVQSCAKPTPAPVDQVVNVEATAKKEKPDEKDSSPKKEKVVTTPKSSLASAPTTESSSETQDSPAIDYPTVQAAVLDISKKSRLNKDDSRAQAVALLQRFGALKDGAPAISVLSPEFYGEVMKLYPRIMSGELDMTASLGDE